GGARRSREPAAAVGEHADAVHAREAARARAVGGARAAGVGAALVAGGQDEREAQQRDMANGHGDPPVLPRRLAMKKVTGRAAQLADFRTVETRSRGARRCGWSVLCSQPARSPRATPCRGLSHPSRWTLRMRWRWPAFSKATARASRSSCAATRRA